MPLGLSLLISIPFLPLSLSLFHTLCCSFLISILSNAWILSPFSAFLSLYRSLTLFSVLKSVSPTVIDLSSSLSLSVVFLSFYLYPLAFSVIVMSPFLSVWVFEFDSKLSIRNELVRIRQFFFKATSLVVYGGGLHLCLCRERADYGHTAGTRCVFLHSLSELTRFSDLPKWAHGSAIMSPIWKNN